MYIMSTALALPTHAHARSCSMHPANTCFILCSRKHVRVLAIRAPAFTSHAPWIVLATDLRSEIHPLEHY